MADLGKKDILVKKGIILIDKPREMTSFGVVSRLRRLIGVKKIGHTGTLDPFAEGLLAICVGQATSVVQFMDNYDKTYQVRVVFGTATDTMDLTGTVIDRHVFGPGELEALRNRDFAPLRQAVARLVGPAEQLPPMYSAVKIDGRPLYTLAREGQTIERATRPIIVHEATIDRIDCYTETEPGGPLLAVEMTLAVSKGTYIRVIADELGRSLGWFAHAERLVRTAVGPFALSQAIQLDWLAKCFDDLTAAIQCPDTVASQNPGAGQVTASHQQQNRLQVQDQLWQMLAEQQLIHGIDEALAHFPAFLLSGKKARQVVQGQKLAFTADAVVAGLMPGSRPFDPRQDQAGATRLTLYSSSGLLGVGHFLADQDAGHENYRLVTERIFLNHECLLPE